jgi:hypothetical protein
MVWLDGAGRPFYPVDFFLLHQIHSDSRRKLHTPGIHGGEHHISADLGLSVETMVICLSLELDNYGCFLLDDLGLNFKLAHYPNATWLTDTSSNVL